MTARFVNMPLLALWRIWVGDMETEVEVRSSDGGALRRRDTLVRATALAAARLFPKASSAFCLRSTDSSLLSPKVGRVAIMI